MKRRLTYIILLFLTLPCFSETYSIYKVNGKYGLINSKAEVVIKAVNQGIYCFDDYIFVIASEKLLKVYNTELEQIDQIFYKSGTRFQNVYHLSNSLFCIELDHKSGSLLYNAETKTSRSFPGGKVVEIYSEYEFDDVLVMNKTYDHYYLSSSGEPMFDGQHYDWAYPFVNGRAVVVDMNGETTIIDETGQSLLQVKASGQYFREGLLPVILLTGETGYINYDCEFVFHCPLVENRSEERLTWQPIVNYYFSDGFAYIQVRKDVWQVYDINGNPVSGELGYSPVSLPAYSEFFVEGLLPVRDPATRKIGYINTKGELAIPAQFSRAEPFDNGLAKVCDSETKKYGFINTSGEYVIPAVFSYVEPFENGYATARDFFTKKVGYINTLGEYVIPPVFDFIEPFINGYAVVKYEGRDAVVDMTGTIYFSTELQKQN